MTKLHVFFLSLIFCSLAFAEQAVLICEVPADEEGEGCGPNNTYETYRLSVETDDFNKKGGATYGLQIAKGCDASKATKIRNKYTVAKDTVKFNIDNPQNIIAVDRESLNGTLSWPSTHSPNLTCEIEEGSSEAWSKGQKKWWPSRNPNIL